MLKIVVTLVVFAAYLCERSPRALAEDWPAWRGPRGDGTSLESTVPIRWNGQSGENIVWTTVLPGEGHGSPVVVRDRIFLQSCLTERLERVVVCVDRRTGQILWQRTVVQAPLEKKHKLNSFASATPAADGESVYTTFLEIDEDDAAAKVAANSRELPLGRLVVAAYDFSGNRRWIVRPGKFSSVHGFCSSPVLFEDLVIVNGDHDGDSYIVALKKQSGEVVWKRPRAHKTRSYVTPLIREIGGKPQMVFSGSKHVAGLDPHDGSTLWTVDGPTEQFVASPVYDDKNFYIVGGFPTFHVMAIRPDGTGNVTDTHVAWHVTNASCYVPSPIVVGEYLLVADDRGTANCFATDTGKRLWQTRLGPHYSASLIAVGGLVYFTADDGVTKVIQPGETLDVRAENSLGEACYASPAVSDRQLFFRGEKHLFCVGQSSASASASPSP